MIKRFLIECYLFLLNLFMFFHRLIFSNIKIKGLKIHTPKNCDPETYFQLVSGSYEKEEIAFVEKFLRSDDSVLELGASIGVVSVVCNKILHNKKNHTVVEANPNVLNILNINKYLNDCEFDIVKCLASRDEMVTFNVDKKFLGSSSYRSSPSSEKIKVKSKSLKSIVEDLKFQPNFLIMDIEGAESKILFDKTMDNFNTIIIERHPKLFDEATNEAHDQQFNLMGFHLADKMRDVEVWNKNK